MDLERVAMDLEALAREVLQRCCAPEARAQPHWVPDAAAASCARCGARFGLVLIRRHHCRLCGAVVCGDCSTGRTSLLGWGIEDEVRCCGQCHVFERQQLPMLLAGELWRKPAAWTGVRRRRFLWLEADQSQLAWCAWDDETCTAERDQPRRLELRHLAEVRVAKGRHLELLTGSGETLTFESSTERVAAAWSAALSRLQQIMADRRAAARTYGGGAHGVSPRTVAISSPQLHEALQRRQAALSAARERLIGRERTGKSESPDDSDDDEDDELQLAAAAAAAAERRERSRELHARMREKYSNNKSNAAAGAGPGAAGAAAPLARPAAARHRELGSAYEYNTNYF